VQTEIKQKKKKLMKRKQVPKEKIEIKRQQYVGENVAEIEKMSKLK